MEQEKLPQVLWHYTTQEGLLSIIESGSLHASNIFYLNDATEYTYATGVINDVLNNYLVGIAGDTNPYRSKIKIGEYALRRDEKSSIPGKRLDDPDISFDSVKYDFIKRIRDVIDELTFNQIYILSFSAKEDDLSQWRGYCPNGNGFSIGFRTKDLHEQIAKSSIGSNPAHFDRCIYKKHEQESKIKTIIDDWLGKLETNFGTSKNKEDAVEKFLKYAVILLLDIIPQIKDISFKDEEEWRSIYTYINSPVKFKTGKSMLVPYFEVPLAKERNAKGKWGPIKIIDSVIVGPTPHGNLSKRSVEDMLKANGIKLKPEESNGCEVKLSKIPYRIL